MEQTRWIITGRLLFVHILLPRMPLQPHKGLVGIAHIWSCYLGTVLKIAAFVSLYKYYWQQLGGHWSLMNIFHVTLCTKLLILPILSTFNNDLAAR